MGKDVYYNPYSLHYQPNLPNTDLIFINLSQGKKFKLMILHKPVNVTQE